MGPKGVAVGYSNVVLSRSPKEELSSGSFLWEVKPDSADTQEVRACWTESINTQESRTRQIPEIRIEAGKKRVFLLGHNRLNEKAAQADVLNQWR